MKLRMDISMMAIHVSEGQAIPKHMGIAYWNSNTATCVCWIIPLNLVARSWKLVVDWIRFPGFTRLEETQQKIARVESLERINEILWKGNARYRDKAMAWDALCDRLGKPRELDRL